MKTPRIQDFDPDAVARPLGSPLDGMPRIEKPQPQATPDKAAVVPPVVSRSTESIRETTDQRQQNAPSTTRRYVRRTFDIYDDQLSYLTRAALQERLAGGEGSMNAMIREAIDDFINKRRKK